MFSARAPFWYQSDTASSFGNNARFNNASNFLSTSGVTNLTNWKRSGGYTLEYWFRAQNLPASINPGPGNQDSSSTNYWSFGPISNGSIQFYYWGPGQLFLTTATGLVTTGQWYNIALSCSYINSTNTTVRIYLNGVQRASSTLTSGTTSTGTVFGMGRYGTSAWNTMYIDNLRVSNITRYTSDYTVASAPFTSDGNTELLLICDGSPGSTTISDSSGFNRTMTNNSSLVSIQSTYANHT